MSYIAHCMSYCHHNMSLSFYQTAHRQNHYHFSSSDLHVVVFSKSPPAESESRIVLDFSMLAIFYLEVFTAAFLTIRTSKFFVLIMLRSVKSSSDHEKRKLWRSSVPPSVPLLNGSLLAFSSLPHERENWAINSRLFLSFGRTTMYSLTLNMKPLKLNIRGILRNQDTLELRATRKRN